MVPKFRVWDETQHKMLQVDYIEFIDGKAYWVEASPADGNVQDGNDGPIGDNSQLKLEQYTCLKDINGKEIYEGDIVQYSHQFYEDISTRSICRETGYIGTVIKNNGSFGIFINRMSYTDAHSNYYHADDFVPFCEFNDPEADMALKGNVHTNPELLEAQHG